MVALPSSAMLITRGSAVSTICLTSLRLLQSDEALAYADTQRFGMVPGTSHKFQEAVLLFFHMVRVDGMATGWPLLNRI